MKNRTDLICEALKGESEIAKRKRAFQEESRKQLRDGVVAPDEVSFISKEQAKRSTFKFKV